MLWPNTWFDVWGVSSKITTRKTILPASGHITRVSEYWWEFEMLSEAVTVRLGKQDINAEFLNIGLAADFIRQRPMMRSECS